MNLPKADARSRVWIAEDLRPLLDSRRSGNVPADFESEQTNEERYAEAAELLRKQLETAAFFDRHEELRLVSLSAGADSLLSSPPTVLSQKPSFYSYVDAAGHIHETDNPDGIDPDYEFAADHVDGAEVAAEAFERVQRDSEYIYHVKNRAGEIISEESYKRQTEMRAEMEAQAMEIALSLELVWKSRARAEAAANGEDFDESKAPSAFDKSAQRRRPMIVDPIGRKVLSIVPYRRTNINPVCAQVRRSPMLKHLESFLSAHPLAKMFTFTHGQRVSLSEVGAVRAAIHEQHRDLSKLNAHPVMKKYGCRLQFRATEFGTLYRACRWPRRCINVTGQTHFECSPGEDDPGEIWLHIHSHVFATFERALGAGEFAQFAKLVWKIWGRHWDYGRTINDAREACKYPVKPADYKFAKFTPEDTDRLYQELYKMRLVTPLDGLKRKIRFRKDLALKGVKRRTSEGELSLHFRPDWNARGQRAKLVEVRLSRDSIRDPELCLAARAGGMFVPLLVLPAEWKDTAATRAAIAAEERKASLERFFIAAALLSEIPSASNEEEISVLRFFARFVVLNCPPNAAEQARAFKKAEKQRIAALSPASTPENQIVARLAPAPYFDRVTRPALLMWNFDGDWKKLEAQAVCKELVEAARPFVEGGMQELKNEMRVNGASHTQSSHQSRNCPELFPTTCESGLVEMEGAK